MTLSDQDITILNAARAILSANREFNLTDFTAADVRIATLASVAEDAIFDFLNTANAYGHRTMTYEQLHNVPAEVAS